MDEIRSQLDRGSADFDSTRVPSLRRWRVSKVIGANRQFPIPSRIWSRGHVVVVVPDVHVPQFLLAVAEHAGEALVRFNRLATRIEDDDAVLGLFEEHTPPGDLFGRAAEARLRSVMSRITA